MIRPPGAGLVVGGARGREWGGAGAWEGQRGAGGGADGSTAEWKESGKWENT